MSKSREQAYRDAIGALHLSIKEAMDSIDNEPEIAKAILSAAVEFTNVERIIKDCGCG